MKIPTKDSAGRPNGWMATAWSVFDSPDSASLRPDQVYITAVSPGMRKGPHLHKKRRGMFYCAHGKVTIRMRVGDDSYIDTVLTPDRGVAFVVMPGIPCAIYNECPQEESVVINMPSPAWSKKNPDDHPVENWEDPEDWENWL